MTTKLHNDDELLVTIRCITYNHAQYIRQCLEGFIMQITNFRFEVFVHDDASTDGTDLIIREYAEKYPKLIKPYFETENQYSKHDGSFQRITFSPSYLKGKYIALCEGDDYWIDPFKLQKQVDIIESDPQITMVCNRTPFYSERKHKITSEYYCRTDSRGVLYKKDVFNRSGLYISTCSILYRNHLLDDYPSYCKQCAVGDLPLQIYCSLIGDIYYIDENLSVYRTDNPESWGGKEKWNSVDDSRLNTIHSLIVMYKGFAEDYKCYRRLFLDNVGFILFSNMPSHSNIQALAKYLNFFSEEFSHLPLKWRIIIFLKNTRKPLYYLYMLFYLYLFDEKKYRPLKTIVDA